MRLIACISAILMILAGGAETAGAAAGPTQRDWMVNLVDSMGWSFGLPDQPRDSDYLRILEGERSVRIEAETSGRPTDVVSIKNYTTFGAFSGEGWISGIATPTIAHIRFLLPLSGIYEVTAALRLPGHRISIDGQVFMADGNNNFTHVSLGKVELGAGEHDAEINLPANGSIDFLQFQADPLPPIRPPGGWQPDRPLSLDDLAVTAARALGLEAILPPSNETILIEAESAGTFSQASITDIGHLGAPSGGKWVRSEATGGIVRLDFAPPFPAVYRLSLVGAAGQPTSGTLDERVRFVAEFPSYLKKATIGTFFLEGESTLRVDLPPRGGIDVLILEKRKSEGIDYRRLVGLPTDVDSPPSMAQIDQLLSVLAAIGSLR